MLSEYSQGLAEDSHGPLVIASVSDDDDDEKAPTMALWKDGPRQIQTSITVTRVGNIDTMNETVEARLLIDVYWLPSAAELESKESAWDAAANFQLVNATEVKLQEMVKEPYLKKTPDGTVWHARLDLDAVYKQQFELHAFPFDCQDLMLRVEMGNVNDMIYTAPDQDVVLSVELDLCPLTGWAWVGAALNFTSTDPKLSKQNNAYAQFVISLKLARVWRPYLWRVGFFVFMTMFSSVFVYAMDAVEEAADRLAFAFTLLLTSVAFQFTVHGTLPQVSYLTLLEMYILASVLQIFLVALWCAVVKGLYISPIGSNESEDYLLADGVVFLIHLALLIGFHAAFVVYCRHERGRQLKKLFVTDHNKAPKANLRVKRQSRVAGGGTDVTYSTNEMSEAATVSRSSLGYVQLLEASQGVTVAPHRNSVPIAY